MTAAIRFKVYTCVATPPGGRPLPQNGLHRSQRGGTQTGLAPGPIGPPQPRRPALAPGARHGTSD